MASGGHTPFLAFPESRPDPVQFQLFPQLRQFGGGVGQALPGIVQILLTAVDAQVVVAQQFGRHGGGAAAYIRIQHYPRRLRPQDGNDGPGRQPQGKGRGMTVTAFRYAPPDRGQFSVSGGQFPAYPPAVDRLVKPINAFIHLPEPPAANVGGDNPIPDDFLPHRPLGLPQPIHRMVHCALVPAGFVVVEKGAARRSYPINLVQDFHLFPLIVGFGPGVGVFVIHHIFDQPALMFLLLVIGRRSNADLDNFRVQPLQLGQGIAADEAVKFGHTATPGN